MMRFSPSSARIATALIGLTYGLPFLLAVAPIGGNPGLFLGAVGASVSLAAAIRGARVALILEPGRLTVVNRWRTPRFSFEEQPRLQPCTPWWTMLIPAASVEYLAVATRTRRLPVPAMATIGRRLDSADIEPIVTALEHLAPAAEGSGVGPPDSSA